MKRGISIICIGAILVLLPIWASGQTSGGNKADAPINPSEMIIPRVEFRNAPVVDVLESLCKTAGVSYKVSGGKGKIPEGARITLDLKDVSLAEALMKVGAAAGFSSFSYDSAFRLYILDFGPDLDGIILPSLELNDAWLMDALSLLARTANISFLVMPGVPQDAKVTFNLKNVSVSKALRMICDAVGLEFRGSSHLYVVDGKPTANIAPTKVSIIGGVKKDPRLYVITITSRGEKILAFPGGDTFTIPAGLGNMPPPRPNFPMSDLLVDLDVKDVPLAEAAAKLTKGLDIKIEVENSGTAGIKVTAKIYKMPLGEVLNLIVDQAHLTYSVGSEPVGDVKEAAEKMSAAHEKWKQLSLVKQVEAQNEKSYQQEVQRAREEANKWSGELKSRSRLHTVIYIVPLPELSVSTPGTAQGGGSMGGGYGGVPAR